MDLRVLEYFLMVAEEGNMTRASGLLHVSQPTISRQLMDLETELGKTLLLRTRKNVSLTKDGLLFRETAKEILALYQRALESNSQEEALSGDLYLGTGETESFSTFAENIGAFQKRYPGVRFHIISENADRICEDIEKGLLDLGLVMRPANPQRFESLELGLSETWGVLVPDGHMLAEKTPLTAGDLRSQRLLIPENSAFQTELRRWLGRGAEGRIIGTYNLIYNALTLSRTTSSLVVCLGNAAVRQDGLRFLPFEGMCGAGASLIWKRKPVQPPAAERFLRWLSDSENA